MNHSTQAQRDKDVCGYVCADTVANALSDLAARIGSLPIEANVERLVNGAGSAEAFALLAMIDRWVTYTEGN